MNKTMKDGAITITVAGPDTALLTVRGKDHDMTSEELLELSATLKHAAWLLNSMVTR